MIDLITPSKPARLQTFNDEDPLKVGEPPYKHWEPER